MRRIRNRKIIVRVTDKNKREGVRGDSAKCPIQKAISRYVYGEVSVCPWSYTINTLDGSHGGSLPAEVGKKIRTYDNTGRLPRFQFTITVPETYLRYEYRYNR
jgi:hypothetical protein